MTKEDFPLRYSYEYRRFMQFGKWTNVWEIVGRHGAAHVHISEYLDSDPNLLGGVEFHYRVPPEYMNDRPPSERRCRLLGQPCWHDGSSLAVEPYIEYFKLNDHGMIWRKLIARADQEFARFDVKGDGGGSRG